ncbi:MAG: FkbM family methyltransferase [Devosia sp.]
MRGALASLAYWPLAHARGFLRLWGESGPLLALAVTAANLLRRRRHFWVRLGGFVIEIRAGTPDLMVALDSFGGEFEPLARFPDSGGLIIDAGGYIGTAALELRRLFPQSRIVCLEPSAENLELLRRNVADAANIAVVQAALAAAAGDVALRDAGRGEWGFSIAQPGRALGTVPATTVTSILAREGADRLFVLKLDVEGAERQILESSGPWMSLTEIVVAELHEHLVPGTEAAFAAATVGRANSRLPGEKVLSVRSAPEP